MFMALKLIQLVTNFIMCKKLSKDLISRFNKTEMRTVRPKFRILKFGTLRFQNPIIRIYWISGRYSDLCHITNYYTMLKDRKKSHLPDVYFLENKFS